MARDQTGGNMEFTGTSGVHWRNSRATPATARQAPTMARAETRSRRIRMVGGMISAVLLTLLVLPALYLLLRLRIEEEATS